MNIHFSAFFSSEYDIDIMPFWIEHYLKFQFDSYHVFLHRENGPPGSNIVEQFKFHGFKVTPVDGPYGHGIAQKLHQGLYVDSLPKGDFFVVADADEFQGGPCASMFPAEDGFSIGPAIPDFIYWRELLKHVDVVTGFMVDRFTHRLETCYINPFRQYPYQEHPANNILGNFSPPYLRQTEWPYTRRTKVLAARVGYKVAFEGNHCLMEMPEGAQIAEGYQVYHFAWRASAKQKLIKKAYFTQENCREISGGDLTKEILDSRLTPEFLLNHV